MPLSPTTPRSPELLKAFLEAEIDRRGPYNRRQLANPGQTHMLQAHLVERLTVAGAFAFLMQMLGLEYFEDLNRAEYYTLRDWLLTPESTASWAGKIIQAQAEADLAAWKEAYERHRRANDSAATGGMPEAD